MSDFSELLDQLPIDQLAQQVGASPEEVQRAIGNAVPALLMGLDANAQDPAGADSLLGALGQHSPGLLSGLDLSQIDTTDGAKITHNIFGANEDAVVSQLGGAGGGDSLIKKLLPLLAPIVMSWLAGKLMKVDQGQGRPADTGAGGGGILGQILGQVLGGGASAAPQEPAARPQFKDQAAPEAGTPQMRMPDPGQQGAGTADGGLDSILGGGGGILGDLLGGLLGGGRR